jgi:mycofactocin precursor peptide peptidase
MRPLAARSWSELDGAVGGRDQILAVPVGATEQHGPHLPLDTDSRIAAALALGLARARARVLVAPVLPYGASGEHEGFPGTLSVGTDALEHLVVELVRSATRWAPAVLLVNAHGGNREALARAERRLREEGRAVLAWSPRLRDGDAHAGRSETALMLHLRPSDVQVSRAAPGATAPLAELMPALRADGVRAIAPNGVLGDPRGASADEGAALLRELLDDLLAAVDAWQR